jgi:ATP-dependent DNA helicase RecG
VVILCAESVFPQQWKDAQNIFSGSPIDQMNPRASLPTQQPAINTLKGVGPRTLEQLQKLGITNVQDLLFHLPFRYQDRTRITAIGALREGKDVLVEGKVVIADIARGRRSSLLCRIEDGTGFVSLRFYYFSHAQKNNLRNGVKIRCFGEVRRGATGYELYHPEYRIIDDHAPAKLEQTLTPVYATTDGLSQKKLRSLIAQALTDQSVTKNLRSLLPTSSSPNQWLGDIATIIKFLHTPPANLSDSDIALLEQQCHPAQRHLAFEELVAHHVSLLHLRKNIQKNKAPILGSNENLDDRFFKSLGFQLTRAQKRVAAEIATDLTSGKPMLRLIQGDVGSGKTVVAAIAVLHAIAADFQAAIMVPTEILAQQHMASFQQWLKPLGIVPVCLTGKQTASLKREHLEHIASGRASVIIGTHALFQKDVLFHRLGLCVIDEQHRFGVHQRLSLHNKGTTTDQLPHQLIMTATPIPRTLAMCAYADLDVSIIDELPPGRTPVETIVISDQRRQELIDRIHHACQAGKQAYWVCTLIEESEVLQCQAAEVTATELSTQLPDLAIGLIHGRLSSQIKTGLMEKFKAGEIQLLVATTVIEVGVDVANASLMVIENPERLGLAQLHQLRGRVGRGTEQSYCLLMFKAPLSNHAKQRLAIMRDSSDGFVIAEKDLELRGPGEFLGKRQTGIMQFKIANYGRDQVLFPQARQCAEQIVRQNHSLIPPLLNRWLGVNQQYVQV